MQILEKHEDVSVRVSNEEKNSQFKMAIENKHPNLKDVWATMDDLKVEVERSPEMLIQNCFYNGWTHGHYVSNVLCFCPDGTIPIACVNVPGTVHDSMVAEWGDIYKKLQIVFKRNGGNHCW